MPNIYIGSARMGENGKVTGGKKGDQKQTSSQDYSGEVSMQAFYNHSKKWVILRPKKIEHANKIALAMITACNNANLGYNQNERLGVITYGIESRYPTNCDCSSLVRACVKEATGKDPKNFTTLDEVTKICETGLFDNVGQYVSHAKTPVYNGDILVTRTKGHTAIVVTGSPRKVTAECYPKYTGTSRSIIDALASLGEKDTSLTHRMKIAFANGVSTNNNLTMNTELLKRLKAGTLIKA